MDYLSICKAELPVDEGRKAMPYKDTEGILTIGVGRNLEKGLRPDEIDYLFANDLREAHITAVILFPSFDTLSEARKAVLVNMAFNLGQARLSGFVKMRQAVADGDFGKAAEEMAASKWAVQVGARAVRLVKMMREG